LDWFGYCFGPDFVGPDSWRADDEEAVDLPEDVAATPTSSRWNRDLFGTIVMYGLGAAPLAFGLYAAPLYLSRVLHVSQASLGHLLWVPPAGWETGYLVWGWWSDKRTARRAGRPAGLFASFSAAGFLIVLAPAAARCAHPVAATMLLFYVQMFLAGGVVVLTLSDGMRVQSKKNAGFLAGIAISSWAAVTGALTPVLGRMFDARAYEAAFWLVALLPVAGTILWWGLRSTAFVYENLGPGETHAANRG
jgi:ACS family hexuronate transporter-like MFS transporter